MEKQFCFNYEHYAALAGLSDADRRLVAEAQRATENACAAGRSSTEAISRARCIRRGFAPNVR